MTREEIREGIAKYFWGLEASYPWVDNPEEGTETWHAQRSCYTKADTLISYLHSQGVVIKVENKLYEEHPDWLYLSEQGHKLYNIISGSARTSEASGQPGAMLSVGDIAEAILKAGYIAVEPLIGEDK